MIDHWIRGALIGLGCLLMLYYLLVIVRIAIRAKASFWHCYDAKRCRSWRIQRWRIVRCSKMGSHSTDTKWHHDKKTDAIWLVRNWDSDR